MFSKVWKYYNCSLHINIFLKDISRWIFFILYMYYIYNFLRSSYSTKKLTISVSAHTSTSTTIESESTNPWSTN